MKTAIPQFLILVLTVCLGSLQNTQAVNPPPDGGYPLGNTAEGEDALFSLTANGTDNTAIGFHALFGTTTGDENTAVGSLALNFNTTGGKTLPWVTMRSFPTKPAAPTRPPVMKR